MKTKHSRMKLTAAFLAAMIGASALVGCGQKAASDNVPQSNQSQESGQASEQEDTLKETLPEDDAAEGQGAALAFKPADQGILPQDSYEYPYMGMRAVLTEALRSKMDSKDVLMSSSEDYTQDGVIKYAFLKWFALTEEQKNEEMTAYDPAAWEAGLEKVGTLGVYHKDILGELDTITGCTEHKELGKSADGNFTYYMSFAQGADEALKKELESTEVQISKMEPLDFQNGKLAFSEGRVDAANVGDFKTTDVNGKEYTREMFQEYDLTLVNVYATWCSPCVEEMPEFQEFKEKMADMGIQVAAVVYDAITPSGEPNEDVIGRVKQMQEKAGLTFPMLLPDKTDMNGRLKGIDSYPESFFVDKDGNIVGKPYMGTHTFEEWKEIAEKELADLKGTN